ncbi:multidrug resistance-associated ABC transporter [Athelia psychrophila]|uniref:Multidrug resistance-associated ABC transporter n=1 Tax=Athelia psychrophila TaxID=1759441 RepID=A0A166J5S0_9AGAM|nr:multidrug resistance-associated ABC transporter [Fibularhizoctonia sp. CBS 109695]
MPVCTMSNCADFAAWAAILPTIFVSIFCLRACLPKRTKQFLRLSFFTNFLSLHEAEALDISDEKYQDEPVEIEVEVRVPVWKTFTLSFVAMLQTMLWLVVGSYTLIAVPGGTGIASGIFAILRAVTWFYGALRPIVKAQATVPYDLFILYLVQLVMSCLLLGGVAYEHDVYNRPLPATSFMASLVFNLVATLVLLGVILSMPLALPSNRVKKSDIGVTVSPDDYVTLWGWVTFSWIWPIIKKGTYTTLVEADVWRLSPTMSSKPLFTKFAVIQHPTVIKRLWAANKADMMTDMLMSYLGVVFAYAGPFFLRKILSELDNEQITQRNRSNAYLYAFLAFVFTLLKNQTDLSQLWVGKRLAVRVRTELMAAIYAKALKRKDYSGVIDKDKQQEASDKKADAANANASAADKAKIKQAKDARTEKANEARGGADIGKIVSLMSVDANRTAMATTDIHHVYAGPLDIILGTVFLYRLLGWSAFAGYAMIFATLPINSLITKKAIKIQKGTSVARDKRMQVVNELISAIKFIKFFAWEGKWIARVMEARRNEIEWLVKSRINTVFFYMAFALAPVFVAVVSFWAFILSGNEMNVSIAFTSIALFGMVRGPLTNLPSIIVQLLETKVAIDRIGKFLEEDEVSEQVSSLKNGSTGVPTLDEVIDPRLGIEHASFKWNEVEEKKSDQISGPQTDPELQIEQQHRFELRDVDIIFPEGELSVITGPTASGKSAMLMALLGEMTLLPGGRIIMTKNTNKVDEHGNMHSISYAAQSPWLRHQSIKDNILFGYPYDEERYNAVIKSCALQPDLEILEDGDATEIGARGVNLSGGQKSRVALARAVYARTKYVLLDDPLSAVDSHTSRFLFEKLFKGPLLANRTVVLVTHHVELVLPGTHYLVRMHDGRIETQGTIKDLRAQGVLGSITQDESLTLEQEKPVDAEKLLDPKAAADADDKVVEATKKPRKLVEDEHRAEGGVKWGIYNTYLEASWYGTWVIILILISLSQALGVGERVFMGIWSEAYGPGSSQLTSAPLIAMANGNQALFDKSIHASLHYRSLQGLSSVSVATYPRAQEHPMLYVGIYTAISFASGIAAVASIIVQFMGGLRASRVLFERMLTTVVHATMRWHDTTPQGRMLNRFSKDIQTIDTSLARSLQNVNSSLAIFFAAIATIAYFFPLFLIPAFFLGFAYQRLGIAYLRSGRSLRRMEANSRSPVFSGFGEMLDGLVTVRAFSAERRFLNDLHGKLDNTSKMWYTFYMTNCWLLFNLNALGALVVYMTTLFSISPYVTAGTAGLCITSAMAYTTSTYLGCRYYTTLELDLNSVERIVEYLSLPQEPPATIESNRPPAYWPSSSTKDALISVQNLVVKYAPELPAVLHGVSFDLQAKERIGLLGRTGSGKSTLAMSLLRFNDPVSGKILIDGIDISTIGVGDLRSRLDATLFSGTLRDNLDPFGDHEDSACLDVLRRVQLLTDSTGPSQRGSRDASRVPSIRDDAESSLSVTSTEVEPTAKISLDTQISAGGANFSSGQRQLIAMARALLRHSSVIILDEATSSIDFATDAKIQATIREEFGDSLLLTVAHRLRTVIDYDRLIVLDKGEIAEFDTPLNLINKEGGIFRDMCLKSGTFGELEAEARAKAQRDTRTAVQ